jgi:hypothetical protein
MPWFSLMTLKIQICSFLYLSKMSQLSNSQVLGLQNWQKAQRRRQWYFFTGAYRLWCGVGHGRVSNLMAEIHSAWMKLLILNRHQHWISSPWSAAFWDIDFPIATSCHSPGARISCRFDFEIRIFHGSISDCLKNSRTSCPNPSWPICFKWPPPIVLRAIKRGILNLGSHRRDTELAPEVETEIVPGITANTNSIAWDKQRSYITFLMFADYRL